MSQSFHLEWSLPQSPLRPLMLLTEHDYAGSHDGFVSVEVTLGEVHLWMLFHKSVRKTKSLFKI